MEISVETEEKITSEAALDDSEEHVSSNLLGTFESFQDSVVEKEDQITVNDASVSNVDKDNEWQEEDVIREEIDDNTSHSNYHEPLSFEVSPIEASTTTTSTTAAVTYAALETNHHVKEDHQHDLLIEIQESLQNQMIIRAEAEHKLRTVTAELQSYKAKMEEYTFMEDEIEKYGIKLKQAIAEKISLEEEVQKLRKDREDMEQKEILLNNSLNEAKKAEASKSNALETENIKLASELKTAREKMDVLEKEKEQMHNKMEQLKKKCVERVQLAESALMEERHLNDERKNKMKLFVETKTEELRVAKSSYDELRSELKETKEALHNVRGKLEHMTQQYESASTKNRELLRDITRIKKSSEQISLGQVNLQMELHKSAQETEEHKNKRLTAKHELMTILRKLESEQGVTTKLRDSVTFTFTPKAISQQQLLNQSLEDFETQLLKLSRRLGKALPPSINRIENSVPHIFSDDNLESIDEINGENDDTGNTQSSQGKKKPSRSEWDINRLLSTLDNETQKVSKAIMAFSNAVERMQSLLDESGDRTCVSTLNDMFLMLAAAKTDSLSARLPASEVHVEDEDGFAGSPVRGSTKESYHGLIQRH